MKNKTREKPAVIFFWKTVWLHRIVSGIKNASSLHMAQNNLQSKNPDTSLTLISKPCFEAMQSKASLALTLPYHAEELERIEGCISSLKAEQRKVDNFVAIGAGHFRYADVALKNKLTYVAIEPSFRDEAPHMNAGFQTPQANVHIVPKKFEDVTQADLPSGRNLFFFLFNVFPYIQDALSCLKSLTKTGDIVVISSWNKDSPEAQRLKTTYYGYLMSAFNCHIAPANDYMDVVQTESARMAPCSVRMKSKITDILTMKVR